MISYQRDKPSHPTRYAVLGTVRIIISRVSEGTCWSHFNEILCNPGFVELLGKGGFEVDVRFGVVCSVIDKRRRELRSYFRTDLTLRTTLLGRPLPEVTTTTENLSPLLGLRVTADLSRRWSLDLRGDAASLGTSGTDFYSWEAAAYLGFHVSRPFTVFVGWRAQGQVDVQGTGALKNGTDVTTHGPVVGAGFTF